MVQRIHAAENAMKRKTIELVREGKYAAEVSVELIEEEGGWSPYLSLDDVQFEHAAVLGGRGHVTGAQCQAHRFELLRIRFLGEQRRQSPRASGR
jgi:hypothetical protein